MFTYQALQSRFQVVKRCDLSLDHLNEFPLLVLEVVLLTLDHGNICFQCNNPNENLFVLFQFGKLVFGDTALALPFSVTFEVSENFV